MSHEAKPQSTFYLRKSKARAPWNTGQDVEVSSRRKLEENLTQLQAKLQNSKAEFQNSKDEKVYSSLLSLFEALKDYQSTESSQLNHIDEARLLSRKKLEYLIMNDFNKLFKHISQHFYPDFKMENSPALPFVFHIIDWLALNAQKMHIILSDLLENENVMEGLDWYISSQIIFKRGYIEIFKTDNIQIHLLEHEELRGIRNLLNCDFFVFPLLFYYKNT
ncbi:hypothetical protein BY996DRAFT_2245699 [Phakopsora pachyrhizi]|nr:hypothetical protein BY996DRAFT_2245699 [Phakopsora pachyrhizi]